MQSILLPKLRDRNVSISKHNWGEENGSEMSDVVHTVGLCLRKKEGELRRIRIVLFLEIPVV